MMKTNYQTLIMEGLKELPSEALAEVASFVSLLKKRLEDPFGYYQGLEKFLQSKKNVHIKSPKYLDGKDALLKFIGGDSHGSLAQNIDEELYGK
ncbi:MAG: hypothetical protein WA705_08770 [Candidatus Ozemobacteraceae bacterium]